MATTSACAVGSFVRVTRFAPSAIMRPSFATTAANGPPLPEWTFSSASAMARLMKSGDIDLPFYRFLIVLSGPKAQRAIIPMRGIIQSSGDTRSALLRPRTCKIMKWRYDGALRYTVLHLFSSSGGARAHDLHREYFQP